MKYKNFLKIAVSFLFLLVIVVKIDLDDLLNAFSSVDPFLYFASFVIMILNSVIHAKKYEVALSPSGIDQSFYNLVKINFMVRFYSIFLSTFVGQSVVRWHFTTKNQKEKSRFLAVLVLERTTFLSVLLFVVLVFLMLFEAYEHSEIYGNTYLLLCSGLFLLCLFHLVLLYYPLHKLTSRKLRDYDEDMGKTLRYKIFKVLDAMTIYYKTHGLLCLMLLLALIWHLFYLLRVYILLFSMQATINIFLLSLIASIALLVQVVPISFSGIGLRETAFAFLFRLYGFPAEKGVLVGLLLSSQLLLMAFIGGIFFLMTKE